MHCRAGGDFFCFREMTPLPLYWRLFEAAFQRACRIVPLDPDPACLLAVQPARHHGSPVTLTDGHLIRPGDPILELHFRREALGPLLKQPDPARLALGLLQLADRDIPRLARALRDRPEFYPIQGLHALTLFHRGISRYGFEVREIESPLAERWFTWWQQTLMARDHPLGRRRVDPHRTRLIARHVWCSPAELIRRYGSPNDRASLREAPSAECSPDGR
ncbi:MAG: hypothetical protein FJX77_01980 [Armatimonadetes bacterium]|nr:hypothetical protein [Armatimonadota bacterium]